MRRSTYSVFVVVVIVMILSMSVARGQQIYDQRERFLIAEYDEPEPSDAVRRARLKKLKQRYDKDAPFTRPGPKDEELAFLPEFQFNFPGLPVSQSDVIVVGQVLTAEAHRSENKLNVFSNFEVKVEEVLKGSNLTAGNLIINVQRLGGWVQYPDGQKVLFRLVANGMPAVGGRYAFFLNTLDEDFRILTAYEFGDEGVMALDHSSQFFTYNHDKEADFLTTVRDAIAKSTQQHD